MKAYSYSPSYSYFDYIAANRGQRLMVDSVADNTKAVLGSTERIQSMLSEASQSLRSEIESVAQQMSGVHSELQDISAALSWGFAGVLTSLGRVGDSLQALLQLAKSPAQASAYEQYALARDAFRRGLQTEAIEYLERAIEGYGSNPGHRTEYRFYVLKGTIHMGGNQADREVLDLEAALESFLLAARYARSDLPQEAARALLAAGWASYCLGDQERALRLTDEAISLGVKASGFYQKGKILAHQKEAQKAVAALREAILLNRKLALESLCDPDYLSANEQVRALLEDLRDDQEKVAAGELSKIRSKLDELRGVRIARYTALDLLPEELRNLESEYQRAEELLVENTLYSIHDGRVKMRALHEAMKSFRELFGGAAKAAIQKDLKENKEKLKEIEAKRDASGSWLPVVLGAVGLVLGFMAFNAANDASFGGCIQGLFYLVLCLGGGLVVGIVVMYTVRGIVPESEREVISEIELLESLQEEATALSR